MLSIKTPWTRTNIHYRSNWRDRPHPWWFNRKVSRRARVMQVPFLTITHHRLQKHLKY